MKEHELKCWPPFFHDVAVGVKRFELRRDDRAYEVGDVLHMREWVPESQRYTGASMRKMVVYKMPGGQFGIEEGYCVLGLDADAGGALDNGTMLPCPDDCQHRKGRSCLLSTNHCLRRAEDFYARPQ